MKLVAAYHDDLAAVPSTGDQHQEGRSYTGRRWINSKKIQSEPTALNIPCLTCAEERSLKEWERSREDVEVVV